MVRIGGLLNVQEIVRHQRMASKGQASAGDSAVAPIGWNYPVRAALGGRVLSREWLRSWLAEGAAAVREFARVGRYPLVQRVYAREVFDRLMLLWARGQELLDALDRLPHVLGHNDAFLRNLFLRSERLLAIDWAFLGPGPVGAELAPLVTASVAFRGVARDRWRDLEQTALRRVCAVCRRRGGVAHQISPASASQPPQRSATAPAAFGSSCQRYSMRLHSPASRPLSAFPSTKCSSSGPLSATSKSDSPTTHSRSSPRSTYEPDHAYRLTFRCCRS
jgi:Phosphotransferase enzyme family